MATLSRNAVPFMRRCGLIDRTASPAPRLDVDALTVATLPETENPDQGALQIYEGDPAPDRDLVRPWPYS